MVALGPAVGFIMGSLFESEWINVNDKINIDIIIKSDPRWIGRWWMGFIISSCLLILLSFILFTYPSQLKQNQSISSSSHPINIKGLFFSFFF